MSIFNYNQDHEARDLILRVYLPKDGYIYTGGIVYFKNVPYHILQELVDERHANPQDAQNDAPTFGEILDFMERRKEFFFTARGYIVSPERPDYRVTIEGIQTENTVDPDCREEFVNLFGHADEFSINPCFCWFD